MAIQERTSIREAAEPGRDTGRWGRSSVAGQLWVLTVRQVRVVYADRRIVLFNLLQPLIMLVLFSQVFGSMADPAVLPRSTSYVDFLMPALLVTTGIGSAQGAGTGLIGDMDSGMVSRFRSMPVNPFLVLLARSLTDLTRVISQLLVLVVCGVVLLDFAPSGGFLGLTAALVLAVVLVWSLIWVFIALAVWLRSVEVLSSIGFLVTFPLMFVSSAFIPVEAMPDWLRVVSAFNPVTHAVDACRRLALGWDGSGQVALALAASIGLACAAAVSAVRGFKRPPGE
ncbi:ABC transporter permease [Saccharothrix sp. AJ9571]|nr:ABC transporter permease [Saccharothrix sp. AJ9571]